MRQLLYLISSFMLLSNSYALTETAPVAVSYNVARLCGITNLPATISLNAQGGQTFSYSTNFNLNCNTSSEISLTLQSINGSASQMRLRSQSGNRYINYTATINGVNYPSNVPQMIAPNANSYLLYLDFAAPDYANTFRDTLTFTLIY